MKYLALYTFLLYLFSPGFPLLAQMPQITDFRLDGDARQSGNNCIILTPDYQWSSGSIWYKKAISLKSSFDMQLRVMLGCKDRDGADGMVFVFHPYAERTGYRGEGMGFAGLNPAIGIEIDTWQNEHLGDPREDHVAILRDGSVNHGFNLAGPNRIPNIEDCREHDLNINWNADSRTLSVRIDGKEVISLQRDLVRTIFRGKDKVYWGVTSATGNYNNRQAVCFEKLEFELVEELPTLELQGQKLKELMRGRFITLDHIQFESGGAQLTPASRQELDELARIMRAHPDMQLDIIGHTDNVGSAATNLSLSEKRSRAVAEYLKQKGISPKRLNSRGMGEKYPSHSNDTQSGRLRNRRVELRLLEPIA
ncbi:MAG: lectin-like domain-containing protein [Phaeodactylibacter xiamenensis]|uniref:lectin-like domain-containing protein n=1 Tax=Phaeodactylibacter xiamenensis TaxID=1524460 RepID=UPI0006982C81|nr:OmpA family protein [Phaeodactylibacter xiamenensis]MCR9050221.1 OmpA family protein [bacterium]